MTKLSLQDKRTRKKKRWGKTIEYTSYERALVISDDYDKMLKELRDDYSKRKSLLVITPQELAGKKDIRVSVARNMLEDLEKEGILKTALKSSRVKVFSLVQ